MEKSFDCLKMKDAVQAEIYEETRGMTNEELFQYWKNLEKQYVSKGLLPKPEKDLAHANH